MAIQADSGNPAALTATANLVANKLGSIDIFVSGAGTLLFKPIEEFTLHGFDHIVALI